jgi:diketogulonate reductase-like aldo/keto reductase
VTRAFGATGAEVAILGQGTANLHLASRADAVRALRRGIDLGLTHLDTAELYGVEELVGEALAGRRDQVFLTSKFTPDHASRDGVVRACEDSLRRLATDRLDLYLLHWPSDHPLEETVAGLSALVSTGKIRFWGVSNFDAPELEELIALAGPGRVACNQVLYHLGERYAERALLPLCARHGVALVGYSPFGAGRFPSPPRPGARELTEIAAAHDATARQVALAFLTRLPGTFAIPKAADVAHVEENAGAAGLTLAPVEVARLDAVFPVLGSSLPLL